MFVEQCKIRGKDFDALNTGWVKQKKIGEPDEEMDEPEDLEEEDDLTEDEEDDLFEDEDDDLDDDDEIVITPPTTEPSKDDKPKDDKPKSDDLDLTKKDDAPVPEKPEVSASDLDAIFGVEPKDAAPTADAQPAKPKLKLNIKPPTAQQAQPSAKPGNIKLNLKNKPKT